MDNTSVITLIEVDITALQIHTLTYIYIYIVQTFELTNLKFGLYNPLRIDGIR